MAPPPKTDSIHVTAAEVEAQFYEALQRGDIERLMACWSDDDDIVLVHPGGPRVMGPRGVRVAFEALFAHGPIEVSPDEVRIISHPGAAVHSVRERVQVRTEDGLQVAWVLATNVYGRTPQGWRMLAHHASPSSPLESREPQSGTSVLH